ncbi:hypothetical protein ACFFIP_11250 [Fontibacter flavus]|uniref:Uncharacterized protein n=1 Tax=Fontibacter flavus TaxID=654838 RepID=A0ABV6FUH1_9BACT
MGTISKTTFSGNNSPSIICCCMHGNWAFFILMKKNT